MQKPSDMAGSPHMPVDVGERAAPRFTLLIRTMKLVIEDRQYLCVVRDVSATGACVRCFHPIPQGRRMAIEFQPGGCHPVELTWRRGQEAGFQFLTPINVDDIVTGFSEYPKRDLRFDIAQPVSVAIDTTASPATLANVSRQGGLLQCDQPLSLDQMLRLEADGFPDIVARVRWRKPGLYGLVFDTTFSLGQLAALICDLHARAQRPATPAIRAPNTGVKTAICPPR